MDIRKLTDQQRQQLWSNLLNAERSGKTPEKCVEIRKQFQELRERESNFFKSMAELGTYIYTEAHGKMLQK
jgi:hypothetical protein